MRSGSAEVSSGIQADFDDQGSPLTIRQGDQLIISFASAFPTGTVLAARVQYGLYQGTPGQATPVAGSSPAPTVPVSI